MHQFFRPLLSLFPCHVLAMTDLQWNSWQGHPARRWGGVVRRLLDTGPVGQPIFLGLRQLTVHEGHGASVDQYSWSMYRTRARSSGYRPPHVSFDWVNFPSYLSRNGPCWATPVVVHPPHQCIQTSPTLSHQDLLEVTQPSNPRKSKSCSLFISPLAWRITTGEVGVDVEFEVAR